MTIEPLFGNWLSETRDLQESVYGVHYEDFAPQKPARPVQLSYALSQLVDYISWNSKAAVHELIELDNETSWKPWQHDEPYVNRDEVVGEAVDVLHFVANILCAVGCDEEELNRRYSDKMAKNRARQRSGYLVKGEGVKCAVCKRALDDVEVSPNDPRYCAKCERWERGVVESAATAT